jgi:hypothetical protein
MNQSMFSEIVGMVLVTTLITPPLLRLLFSMSNKPLEQAVVAGKEAG